MKCTWALKRAYRNAKRKIHLVDRCLIVFMAILMAQSAYNLFANEAVSQETNHIDVIVRTSAAAIFGYFISANFIKKCVPPSQSEQEPDGRRDGRTIRQEPTDAVPQARIGFSARGTAEDTEPGGAGFVPDPPQEREPCGRLQIVVVASVGIASLCILLCFRNCAAVSVSSLGTISQLRDFVSGCVGFLIGSTTDGAEPDD